MIKWKREAELREKQVSRSLTFFLVHRAVTQTQTHLYFCRKKMQNFEQSVNLLKNKQFVMLVSVWRRLRKKQNLNGCNRNVNNTHIFTEKLITESACLLCTINLGYYIYGKYEHYSSLAVARAKAKARAHSKVSSIASH